jgi:tRNA uridine 5-carboxymethylaminomethyl modification enzyme
MIRPTTLGQAARIQGVTPAEISLIAVMLRKAGAAEKNDA